MQERMNGIGFSPTSYSPVIPSSSCFPKKLRLQPQTFLKGVSKIDQFIAFQFFFCLPYKIYPFFFYIFTSLVQAYLKSQHDRLIHNISFFCFSLAYKIWPLFSPMVLPHFKHSRFKDDQHCSHRIAEVLDPDGKISPAQISNMLKRLGLAVAPRRKMCDADAEGPLARKPKDLFIQ